MMSMYPAHASLRTQVVFLFHRMVACLGEHLVPYLPATLPPLIQTTTSKNAVETFQLVNQLLSVFFFFFLLLLLLFLFFLFFFFSDAFLGSLANNYVIHSFTFIQPHNSHHSNNNDTLRSLSLLILKQLSLRKHFFSLRSTKYPVPMTSVVTTLAMPMITQLFHLMPNCSPRHDSSLPPTDDQILKESLQRVFILFLQNITGNRMSNVFFSGDSLPYLNQILSAILQACTQVR